MIDHPSTDLPTDEVLRRRRDEFQEDPGSIYYRGADTLIRILRLAGSGALPSRWTDKVNLLFDDLEAGKLTVPEVMTACIGIGDQMDAAGEEDPERWERYRQMMQSFVSDAEVTKILQWEKAHGWHNGQPPALRPPRGKDIGYERYLDSIYGEREK